MDEVVDFLLDFDEFLLLDVSESDEEVDDDVDDDVDDEVDVDVDFDEDDDCGAHSLQNNLDVCFGSSDWQSCFLSLSLFLYII